MDKKIKFRVNGTEHEVEVPTNRLLVDLLRYDLGLTGTKEGCSVGVCGACTVLIDGEMVSSCIALAVFADGHDVTTVEGLAQNGELHPVQQSFIRYGGFPVRHLHPGPGGGGQGVAGPQPQAQRGRNQGLDDGEPVPLHRLLQDHRVHREGARVRQVRG